MTETTTPQTETTATHAAKPKAVRVNLVAGAKRIKIEAHPRREGIFKFYVETEKYADATRKGKVVERERGAFAEFPTRDAAKAHADKVAAQLKKLGWAVPVKAAGFPKVSESFTRANLPKPDKK